MTVVVVPEGSPLALGQKLVKTQANKKKVPAAKPKKAKAAAAVAPRGRGLRKDGKPRRLPGTNPAASREKAAYGKRVAAARHKKDLTQSQLAAEVKLSQPGLANIERGVVGASDAVKTRIEKTLGVKK
jgi:ribosome-binding protein aMBF1 (putative translation factor)